MLLAWRLHSNPVYDSSTPLYLDLSGRFEFRSAQFETTIEGGFGTAQIEIEKPTIEDARAARKWFMKWLRVTSPSGQIVYEGVVAEVHAQIGYDQYDMVIDNFANRLYAEYQWAGSYVGVGKCPKGQTCKGRAPSTESDVATSSTIAEWGIKEKWIDITGQGVISPGNAESQADKELLRALNAHSVERTNDEQAPDPMIQLVIWGPYQTLGFRKQTAQYKTATEIATIVSGALTTGSKAQYINTTDLTQLATTGTTRIYNADAKPQWLNDYIAGAIDKPDSNGRELFFQVWENRRPFLTARSSSVSYITRSDDPRTFGVNRAVIPDYMVRAGGLRLSENSDLGIGNYSDQLQHPYVTLVETTNYDDIAERVSYPTNDSHAVTTEKLLAKLRNRFRANL